jgi:hypothetical protein
VLGGGLLAAGAAMAASSTQTKMGVTMGGLQPVTENEAVRPQPVMGDPSPVKPPTDPTTTTPVMGRMPVPLMGSVAAPPPKGPRKVR